jgi:hypothetical protein
VVPAKSRSSFGSLPDDMILRLLGLYMWSGGFVFDVCYWYSFDEYIYLLLYAKSIIWVVFRDTTFFLRKSHHGDFMFCKHIYIVHDYIK